jgi:hypothetical protein
MAMFALLHALGMFIADLFKSRSRFEAENLFLRHQLNVAMRRAPPRLILQGSDRAFLVWMIRLIEPPAPNACRSGAQLIILAIRYGWTSWPCMSSDST